MYFFLKIERRGVSVTANISTFSWAALDFLKCLKRQLIGREQ